MAAKIGGMGHRAPIALLIALYKMGKSEAFEK
jgi:hypothetical protein